MDRPRPPGSVIRRRLRLLRPRAGLVGVFLLLAGCGGTTAVVTQPSAPSLQAQIVASEVVVGDSRLPLGILDQNTPVSDAVVRVRLFTLSASNTLQLQGASDAPFKGDGLQGKGVYVATFAFQAPGNWLAEVTAQRPGGIQAVLRLPFSVVATGIVPSIGQAAPLSNNPTIRVVPDVSYIDSGIPPDDMHQLSIAQAIAQHQPTVVVFASPALCSSQICGPEVHAVQSLESAYAKRVVFIHVEPYQLKPQPSLQNLSPTTLQWRLQNEPWVFVIDSQGIIRARFEGPTGADEIKAAIDRMLVGG